jgi:hypothetical protein
MIDEKPIFGDCLEYYPDEYEEGFDGVHFGSIKGISEDAPDEAVGRIRKLKS